MTRIRLFYRWTLEIAEPPAKNELVVKHRSRNSFYVNKVGVLLFFSSQHIHPRHPGIRHPHHINHQRIRVCDVQANKVGVLLFHLIFGDIFISFI